jgi:uncharacterized RDD family membrane protein YckC
VAEVITGEAVVIDVPCARFPSRAVALAIDIAVQLVLLVGLAGVAIAVGAGGGLDPAAVAAISLTVTAAIIVGYPTIFETLSRGRSLGKLALGLRVVSDDGGPERFRQALMRALVAVLEIWLTLGFLALVSSLLSGGGKRLGDIFAGTFVINERLPQQRGATAQAPVLPPALAGWAASLELSGLSDVTAETARQYLSRYYDFTPAARAEHGQRIASAVAVQVSPVAPAGTSPPDYLCAVLAERRARAQARLMAQVPADQATSVTATGEPPTGELAGGEAASAEQVAGDPPSGQQPGGPPPTVPAHRPGGFLPPQ